MGQRLVPNHVTVGVTYRTNATDTWELKGRGERGIDLASPFTSRIEPEWNFGPVSPTCCNLGHLLENNKLLALLCLQLWDKKNIQLE